MSRSSFSLVVLFSALVVLSSGVFDGAQCASSATFQITGQAIGAGGGVEAQASADEPAASATESAVPVGAPESESHPPMATIPGPLLAFERMAGISPQVPPKDVMPMAARKVMSAYRNGEPDTFLVLLRQYMQQARELSALAGPQGVLRVPACGPGAQPLLQVLGYRLEAGCGPAAALETADPDKAFLTVDSGFPLAELEDAFRKGKPFTFPFRRSELPVLFSEADWLAAAVSDKSSQAKARQANARGDLLDLLLRDAAIARLYWSVSRMDEETAASLRPGLSKLLPYTAALDFYGGEIAIRSGKVMVPGGATAEAAWSRLVGADVQSPEKFVLALLDKDQGTAAAYFDALARLHRSQQAYFTGLTSSNIPRLRVFYEAFRQAEKVPPLSDFVFHPYPGLQLLVDHLRIDSNGRPHVPGNLAAWKEIVARLAGSAIVQAHLLPAENWTDPEQLVQALFVFSRTFPNQGLLPLYLSLSEIDRGRPANVQLSAQTGLLLANKYQRFGQQYSIFCEFGGLDDDSIALFLSTAENLGHIHNRLLRADSLGIFEANVSLWQILARQGQIRFANQSASWRHMLEPFARVASSAQLFDAGIASLQALTRSAADGAEFSQAVLVGLLGGPNQSSREGRQVRQFMVNRIQRVLKDQQTVSVDALVELAGGLNQKMHSEAVSDQVIARAGELRLDLPQPMLTPREKTQYSAGPVDDRHALMEARTTVAAVLRSPPSAKSILAAKGQLAAFLRDTLVALNYAYYEPPGSQVLHHNSSFVRSHDFSPENGAGAADWQTGELWGKGHTALGTARLTGSLADLPYVLAQVDQNFVMPRNTQALIWEALVPSIMDSATVPRWWRVTPEEMHAAALYQRAGEELVASSSHQKELRQTVVDILSDCMFPRETEAMEKSLEAGRTQDALAHLLPAESFYLTAEFRRRFPEEEKSWGPAGRDLAELARRDAEAVSVRRLSEDFGVPHPGMARNYGLELVGSRIFPAYSEYSSELLAESWESNNLYWARLADEQGYAPVELNRIVPEMTLRMVESIFACHFEDWPALDRAMRTAGEQLRDGEVTFRSGGDETVATNPDR